MYEIKLRDEKGLKDADVVKATDRLKQNTHFIVFGTFFCDQLVTNRLFYIVCFCYVLHS